MKKREINKIKKDLLLATQQCIGCEFCVPSCPLHFGWLTDSATGKMQSLHYAMKWDMDIDERLMKIIYSCTLCGACEYKCKSLSQSVKVVDIIKKAREMFVKAGKGPLPVHKKMIEAIEALGNPLQEPSQKRKEAYPSAFERKDRAETLLFFGCLTSYQDFEIIPSTIRILQEAKEDFTALELEEFCCGYVAHLVGAEDDFKRCQEKNISSISKVGAKRLVTTCAGCFLTFKNLYKEDSLNGISVLHSVQYIENLIKEGRVNLKPPSFKKVIYHDPCDLGRHLGIFEPPREILKKIPGVELLEFEKNRYNAECCGGGGGYKAIDSEKSLEVAEKRVLSAVNAGAEVIVSACPSCKRNLQLVAKIGKKQKRWEIDVMDLTEIVSQAINT